LTSDPILADNKIGNKSRQTPIDSDLVSFLDNLGSLSSGECIPPYLSLGKCSMILAEGFLSREIFSSNFVRAVLKVEWTEPDKQRIPRFNLDTTDSLVVGSTAFDVNGAENFRSRTIDVKSSVYFSDTPCGFGVKRMFLK